VKIWFERESARMVCIDQILRLCGACVNRADGIAKAGTFFDEIHFQGAHTSTPI
jgi:hypothetical protein